MHDAPRIPNLFDVWPLNAKHDRARVRAVQESDSAFADQGRPKMVARNGDRTMTAQNRCRRSNGTLRAWFATREEAVAYAENPTNTAYRGDIPVRCLKLGCGGWHLSQPHWPDAAAAKAMMN